MNKELINTITRNDFNSVETLDELYVVILDNKLFSPRQGRTFHDCYNDAWRHFYSQFNWRAKSKYKQQVAKANGYNNWWECKSQIDKTDRQIWEAFKAEIIDNYGFKIVQWKDVKRDIYDENRA